MFHNRIPKFKDRDLITTQDWEISELESVLDLAFWYKDHRAIKDADRLKGKTVLLFFRNPSVRTRISFEVAIAELGGSSTFIEPRSMRLKDFGDVGETVEDLAKVASRYVSAIGIRILEEQITYYGQGELYLREFAKYADVPVISLAHDKYHPCQGLADIMGWAEIFGYQKRGLDILAGKKLLISWGPGKMARAWGSVQESLLTSTRFGMNVTLAHPKDYELDPAVIEQAKINSERSNGAFRIVDNPVDGYKGVDVVYCRNWISKNAYAKGEFNREIEVEKSISLLDWRCDEEKMKSTNDAFFTHPMPIDRNREVTDSVASGKRSCIYEVAEARLHVQKALLSMMIG